MNDLIWVSAAPGDSRLAQPFVADVVLADEGRAVDTIRRNKAGEPLPAELFLKGNYARRVGDKAVRVGRQPHLFTSGFWYVSAECAAVLRDHDLGQSAAYPTRLFQEDRRTPVEGEYFCLDFGNTKEALLPERSPEAVPAGSLRLDNIWWNLPLPEKDDAVAVSRAALAGPDL